MDEPMRLFDTDVERVTPLVGGTTRNANGRAPVSKRRRHTEPGADKGSEPNNPSRRPANHPEGLPPADSEGVAADLPLPARNESTLGEDSHEKPGDASLGPRLVSINCAAKLLGVGRTTLYEQIAAGHLQVVHIGRATRVTLRAIDAFVEELERRTSQETSSGVRHRSSTSAAQ